MVRRMYGMRIGQVRGFCKTSYEVGDVVCPLASVKDRNRKGQLVCFGPNRRTLINDPEVIAWIEMYLEQSEGFDIVQDKTGNFRLLGEVWMPETIPSGETSTGNSPEAKNYGGAANVFPVISEQKFQKALSSADKDREKPVPRLLVCQHPHS